MRRRARRLQRCCAISIRQAPITTLTRRGELFPKLLAALPGDEATRVKVLVQHLVADHREMEALWARLRKTLELLARGEASSLDAELVARFVALYTRHMTAEEREVLRLAERFLPHKVLVEIGQAMAQRRGVKRAVGD